MLVLSSLALGACPHQRLAGQEADAAAQGVSLFPAGQAWSVPLPAPPSAPAAGDAARAYVPLTNGLLLALARQTGEVDWSIAAENPWTPLVRDGVVYAAAGAGLYALAAETGAQLWTVLLDGSSEGAPAGDADRVLVLTGTALQAFAARDGRRLWTRPLTGGPGTGGGLVVAAGRAYVSRGGHLVSVTVEDGQVLWERDLDGELTAPVVAGTLLLVGSTDNHLYALGVAKGKLAWRWRYGGDVVGTVADGDRVYVVALDNVLRSLRRGNGHQLWKRELATRPVTAPVVAGGVVLVAGNDPAIAAFSTADGSPNGVSTALADLEGGPLVAPASAPGGVTIVVVTKDGRAIGLHAPVPQTPTAGTDSGQPPSDASLDRVRPIDERTRPREPR